MDYIRYRGGMRILIAIVVIGLFTAGAVACGSETPVPDNTATLPAPTQAPTEAADTPAPAPTETATPPPDPTDTPAPTVAPEPTDTPAPTDTPTATLEPTSTPEPTDAPAPTVEPEASPTPAPTDTPTATPEPEPTPEPTDASAPTDTPEPEQTSEPELAIATDLAPLGDNLLWVAHFDSRTQTLSAYDPSGTFSPEKALPPGQDVPDPSEIGQLTSLVSGQVYMLLVSENQTVELNGRTENFFQGANQIFWR